MHRHFEHFFGFTLDPGPHEHYVNRLVEVQLVTGPKDDPSEWKNVGAKFPAGRLEDLLKALHHAKKVLDTEYKKTPDGYSPVGSLF